MRSSIQLLTEATYTNYGMLSDVKTSQSIKSKTEKLILRRFTALVKIHVSFASNIDRILRVFWNSILHEIPPIDQHN